MRTKINLIKDLTEFWLQGTGKKQEVQILKLIKKAESSYSLISTKFLFKKASDPFQSNTSTLSCDLKVFICLKYVSAYWYDYSRVNPAFTPTAGRGCHTPAIPSAGQAVIDNGWTDIWHWCVVWRTMEWRNVPQRDSPRCRCHVRASFCACGHLWGKKNTQGQNVTTRHTLAHTLTQVHPNYNCTRAIEIHIRFKRSLHTNHPEFIATQLP